MRKILLLLFFVIPTAVTSERNIRFTDPVEIVAPGSLPWVVHMTGSSNQFTGVLVSNKYILTSAHALDSTFKVECLTANFKNTIIPFSVSAKKYLLHPQYDTTQSQVNARDIALVELEKNVLINERGIKLPVIDNGYFSLANASMVGEVYSASYAGSNTLKQVHLNWYSVHGFYGLTYSGAGEPGDSGSPLFYSKNETIYILAILDNGFPEVKGSVNYFEPVAKYLDFILNNINSNNSSEPNKTFSDWKSVNCPYDYDVVVGLGVGVGVGVTLVSILVAYLSYRYLKQTPQNNSAT